MQITEEEIIPVETMDDSECFSVHPKSHIIPPKKEFEFKINFTPIDNRVYENFLKANMKNLGSETTDLEISLKGESQSFPYHLSSAFIESFDHSDCRFKTYCGLVAGIKTDILNFLSLGVGSECNR